MSNQQVISEYEKQLVVARLEALPPNVGISVGSDDSFTRQELLQHVEDEDNIGKKYIESDLEFLRALKRRRSF